MKVNYIVVCYLGPRRASTIASDPMDMIRYHLDYLQNNNVEDISRVTVVINADTPGDIEKVQNLLKSYKNYYAEIKFFYRRNLGHSYGGWNDAINSSLSKNEIFDYFFLTEDDYGPVMPNFLEFFVNKMTGSVGFVCQKLLEGGSAEHTHHPAISNGLILYGAARASFEKFGTSLLVKPSWDYGMAEWNQRNFINNLVGSGYSLEDISKECSVAFLNYNPSIFKDVNFKLVEHGNPTGPIPFAPLLNMQSMVQLEEHLGEE